MKRRNFLRNAIQGSVGASLVPITSSCQDNSAQNDTKQNDTAEDHFTEASRDSKQWNQMGTGLKARPNRKKSVQYDVAVIGGGMAGICAAVAAGRNGAKVVLVQDRPVLGGNASSEIRVHMNGVNHLKNGKPERETGIIEEILLHNRFNNPQDSYPVWDHILYDFISREKNVDLKLNTSAIHARVKDGVIDSAYCYQMTTETEYLIKADYFIDSSGDGGFAASAGALYRTGREAASEFNEKYAPKEADGWQMGSTVLLGSKDMGKPVPFKAPPFAIPFDPKKSHKGRNLKPFDLGYWWVELGSKEDIIGEYEDTKHKLMGYAYGVWDYMKNSGEHPETENYALDWVTSLPGKRESRRFVGDYILKEPDMLNYKQFDDVVAYGGWSLDEHNPGGMENQTDPPSYFHEKFDEPYQIPFRCLYSKNVSNLFFAGRNISQTHIALSSSRIMATCSLEGQAVGTAAAMCTRKKTTPRELGKTAIKELQENLLRDDAFLPYRPAKDSKDLVKQASAITASSTKSGDPTRLRNGISRDYKKEINHWQSTSLPATVEITWEKPVSLRTVELKCDSNLKRNIMLRRDSLHNEHYSTEVPKELIKRLRVDAKVDGSWIPFGRKKENQRRCIKLEGKTALVTALRIKVEETYGTNTVKLFEVRAYS